MYKFVTFDVKDTLLKLKRPAGEIYAQVGKLYGIHADPELLTSCMKKTFSSLQEHHANFGLTSGLGWENWWKCLVIMTFQCAMPKESFSFPIRSLDMISSRLIDFYNTKEGWSLTDGSVKLLNFLKERNVQIGIISNFDPRLRNILKEMDIDHFFSFIATSYECKCLKPDINIFRQAEIMFQNSTNTKFDANRALHIGDSLENDYLGAKNAGWLAAIISQNNKPYQHCNVNKEFVFSNFNELNNHFLKVFDI